MYVYDPERIAYFATTDYRGKRVPFGIKAKDRLRHMYVIGKTGMGKSTLLENLAIQDIRSGEGLCFIDPHGSTASKLLDYVPKERINDVIYFAPFDMEYPIGFNIMEDIGYDRRHLVVAGLMSAFRRIWVDAWSSRMEYILQNTLLALLEYPDSTLIDVNRMYVDKNFRKKVVENVTDPIVKAYWTEEFTKYTDRYTQEATPAIQNKIGQFTGNPLIRNIIGQPKSTINIRQIMDERKILIVNLSKGRIGEQNADLLGSILTTKIYLEAMGRAELPEQEQAKLPPFYLFVDEFQSVVNDSFANILSEARKYKLALTLAHQYIEQIDENIRAAVFGNAGTIITFRVGPFDAEVLKTIFEPTFTVEDIVNLGFAQIYLSLMIDGVATKPFSARTLPPFDPPEVSYRNEIIRHSQLTYGRPRQEVEEQIKKATSPERLISASKKQTGSNEAQSASQTKVVKATVVDQSKTEKKKDTKQRFDSSSGSDQKQNKKVVEQTPAQKNPLEKITNQQANQQNQQKQQNQKNQQKVNSTFENQQTNQPDKNQPQKIKDSQSKPTSNSKPDSVSVKQRKPKTPQETKNILMLLAQRPDVKKNKKPTQLAKSDELKKLLQDISATDNTGNTSKVNDKSKSASTSNKDDSDLKSILRNIVSNNSVKSDSKTLNNLKSSDKAESYDNSTNKKAENNTTDTHINSADDFDDKQKINKTNKNDKEENLLLGVNEVPDQILRQILRDD